MRLPATIAKAARELHMAAITGPVYLRCPLEAGFWYRWQHGQHADRGQFVGASFVLDPPIVDLDDWAQA